MAIQKEHKEFYKVDLDRGWEKLPGYPDGIRQQVLAGFLDEKNRRGSRTRHLRFDPGVHTSEPFVHDYWEEVYLVSGDLIVGNDRNGKGGTRFGPAAKGRRGAVSARGPARLDQGSLRHRR